jgi:CubicO group peptidase (beta-lactamase class C family)
MNGGHPEWLLTHQAGITDPNELGAFMDELIAEQLDHYQIPGAAVSVVNYGELFLAKGYGYANLDNEVPVTADRTLFRIGSVSKLFTWTALMQLVEQGKLDLTVDINTYLHDFQIPATYPEPITLEHLLTHTAGFEGFRLNSEALRASELLPLGEVIVNNMPARVRPPGKLAAYSNYGAALAGYIVEQVSAVPFQTYVADNILKPLDMVNATFQQPIPAELEAGMAVGYKYVSGEYQAGEFQYIQMTPAGSMSATAEDMAKFMIAHLQVGRYRDIRMLRESTAIEMHRQHFAHDQRMSGMTYGFREFYMNKKRLIGHTGATNDFRTILALLPEQNVGLFISYNSAGATLALDQFLQMFLDHYYPEAEESQPQPLTSFEQHFSNVIGYYRPSNSSYTTFEKLSSEIIRVSAHQDGAISINQAGYTGKPLLEVEPFVFRDIKGQRTLIFHEDDKGHVTHMFSSNIPNRAYIKLRWYETPIFQISLLVTHILVFLSVIIWPTRGFGSRHQNRAKNRQSLRPRLVRWLLYALSVFSLLFLIGLAFVESNLHLITYGVPPLLYATLILAILSAVLTAGNLAFTIIVWKRSYWGLVGRLRYTLVTLVAVAFVWQLGHFNLLGFHF